MKLNQFRLAFIFIETLLGPLESEALRVQARLQMPLRRHAYYSLFDGAREKWPPQAAPAPPWPKRGYQGFWVEYFEDKLPLDQITGGKAWHALVPIRLPAPVTLTAARVDRVQTEGFVHPWGVTLVVTLTATGSWDNTTALGQLLFDIRH